MNKIKYKKMYKTKKRERIGIDIHEHKWALK